MGHTAQEWPAHAGLPGLSEYIISYRILGGPNHKKLEAFGHGGLEALTTEPAGVPVI